jgi:hypothetical protein
MAEYILLNVIMLSAGVLLYLYMRSLPSEQESGRKHGWFEKFAFSDAPELLDKSLKRIVYKFLRRANVYVLKTENWIMGTLGRLKPFAEPEPGRLDFSGLKESEDAVNSPEVGKEDEKPGL